MREQVQRPAESGRAASSPPRPASPGADSGPALSPRTSHDAGGVPLHADTIPEPVAQRLSARVGFDVRGVRIHRDASAARANAAAGSRAFAEGRDIYVARDAPGPMSASGEALLAHELAHVAQHLAADPSPEAALEAQARRVEDGMAVRPRLASEPAGVVRRFRRGAVVALTITPRADGSASFSAQLEGDGVATATGTARDLPEGVYLGRRNAARILLTTEDGSPMPRAEFFTIPDQPGNRALLGALEVTTGRIRITVTGVAPARGPGRGDSGGPAAALRRRLEDLPQRIRDFLFRGEPRATQLTVRELESLLRIADKLAELSDEELQEYTERTTGTTTDLSAFETSIDAWVRQVAQRRATIEESERSAEALIGLDAAYEMYRGWMLSLTTRATSRNASQWEGIPTEELPQSSPHSMIDLYFRMRRAIQPHGMANVRAFEDALARFLRAFRERAVVEAMGLLDRREHLLLAQQQLYAAGGGAAALHGALEPARAAYADAEAYRRAAQARSGASWSPGAVHDFYAAGPEYQQRRAAARAQVTHLAPEHPVLADQGFPVERLAETSDAAEVATVMRRYLTTSLEQTRDTRRRIIERPESIYRLDILVARVKRQLGIVDDSIWGKLIRDHQAPDIDGVVLQVMLAVLALALAPVTAGGSVVAGLAALGISSYQAIETYRDYAERRDAYGAQLLSEEPELAWVVVAVVGVVADLAMVARVIRPVREALRTFQRAGPNGNLAELEARLAGVQPEIRRRILARAELELRASRGWQQVMERVVPPGVARVSVFGLDILAENIGRLAYSIQLAVRRGADNFMRWRLSREAADLIGNIENLTPGQIRQLQALYTRATAEMQRVANAGRSLGLSTGQVDDVLRTWALNGGTVDEVVSGMRVAARGRGDLVVDLASEGASAAARRRVEMLSLDQMTGRINPISRELDWTPVTSAVGRAGYETQLHRASVYGLSGYIRYHIRAPGLGAEGFPLFLAPERANQFANNHIEGFMRRAIDAGSSVRFRPTYSTFSGDELRPFLESLLRSGDTAILNRIALDSGRVERFLKSIVYEIEITDSAGVVSRFRARIDIGLPPAGGTTVLQTPTPVP